MNIEEIQSLFEDLMLSNPDFDESLLEKDEDGYTDLNIDSMYNCFEAGFELGEQYKPKSLKQVHLVWNTNMNECVGFLDVNDAIYTQKGEGNINFGVTALGEYFRDLNDEQEEFIAQTVLIEVEQADASE